MRRVLCSVLLLAQLACTTAPRLLESPRPLLQANPPKRIWVTLASGDQMIIDNPRVYGDTLLGFAQRAAGTREEVWLPLSDLQEVRARQHSGSRTALMGAGIGAAVGLVLLLFPKGSGGNPRPCTNEGEPCEGAQ
jgi:hypothetical protein